MWVGLMNLHNIMVVIGCTPVVLIMKPVSGSVIITSSFALIDPKIDPRKLLIELEVALPTGLNIYFEIFHCVITTSLSGRSNCNSTYTCVISPF